jgi:hypothetical protein
VVAEKIKSSGKKELRLLARLVQLGHSSYKLPKFKFKSSGINFQADQILKGMNNLESLLGYVESSVNDIQLTIKGIDKKMSEHPSSNETERRKHHINPGKRMMEDITFFILVASMIANFFVLGISLNRQDLFFPVSLSAISISLQGYVFRLIAINSISL